MYRQDNPYTHFPIKVAIIVPIYNVETYIEECLQSLLNQTLTNIIIICVNDGSTDTSGDIVEKYRRQDPRIHIITQRNQGIGGARNRGIEYAYQYNPEYIGFVDSDDHVHPTMYEKLYTQATKENADIAYCNVMLYDNQTKETEYWSNTPPHHSFIPREYQETIFQLKANSIWDSIYSFRMIKLHSLRFPCCIYEDLLWFIATFISATKVVHVNEALYIYRQNRPLSTLHTISGHTQQLQFQALYKSYLFCIEWLTNHNFLTLYKHSFYLLLEPTLYSFRGKTLDDHRMLLSYIQEYFPQNTYRELKKKIYKKTRSMILQQIISIRNDQVHKRKVFTFFGVNLYLPIKPRLHKG